VHHRFVRSAVWVRRQMTEEDPLASRYQLHQDVCRSCSMWRCRSQRPMACQMSLSQCPEAMQSCFSCARQSDGRTPLVAAVAAGGQLHWFVQSGAACEVARPAGPLPDSWLADTHTLLRCHMPVRLDVFGVRVSWGTQESMDRSACQQVGHVPAGWGCGCSSGLFQRPLPAQRHFWPRRSAQH